MLSGYKDGKEEVRMHHITPPLDTTRVRTLTQKQSDYPHKNRVGQGFSAEATVYMWLKGQLNVYKFRINKLHKENKN